MGKAKKLTKRDLDRIRHLINQSTTLKILECVMDKVMWDWVQERQVSVVPDPVNKKQWGCGNDEIGRCYAPTARGSVGLLMRVMQNQKKKRRTRAAT